jgi:hypothetical protein
MCNTRVYSNRGVLVILVANLFSTHAHIMYMFAECGRTTLYIIKNARVYVGNGASIFGAETHACV